MSKRRNPTPSYLFHRQSGRARAVWTDTAGVRQQKLLPGAYDSQESRTAFARLQLELEAAPHHRPDGAPDVSANEVLLAFLRHAEHHYRGPDGTTTNEFEAYKVVARYVREVYGEMTAVPRPLALGGPGNEGDADRNNPR